MEMLARLDFVLLALALAFLIATALFLIAWAREEMHFREGDWLAGSIVCGLFAVVFALTAWVLWQ